MAALRWAALNLWSSHDTARDDPPAATPDDESHETQSSETSLKRGRRFSHRRGVGN